MKEFCGIIFAERRATVRLLQWILKGLPQLDFLKVGILVGHGSNRQAKVNSSSTSMPISRQNEVVRSFRTGQINLMIATQVFNFFILFLLLYLF